MTEATVVYLRALEKEITALVQYVISTPELEGLADDTARAKAALVRETHGEVPMTPPQQLRCMKLTHPDGRVETLLIVTLHGGNRHPEVLYWHRRVMVDHFGLDVNYIQAPFPHVSHGACMNQIMAQTLDLPTPPDYYLFVDNDCVALRRDALNYAYQQVCDRLTMWGHLWCSNHKLGPNGTTHHPYASQACLMFSRQLYLAVGRPDMDHWVSRSDTAEELTYAAKAAGYGVSLLYPSGPLQRPLWHHTSQAPSPRHVEIFIETCKMVLAGAFEGDKPALPYAYSLPQRT